MKMPMVAVDDKSVKEIFYHVGLTFFEAHSLEECVLGTLAGCYAVRNSSRWEEKFLKEIIKQKLTLGKLIEKTKEHISFEPEDELLLKLSNSKRNHFMHHYFYESFGLLSDSRGHAKIIEDMNEMRALFQRASNIIRPLSKQFMIAAGMSEEIMNKAARMGMKEQLKARGIKSFD